MQTLLIASQNPGKIAEYRLLLNDLHLVITSLAEQSITHQAPETGDTFAENACQKASTFAKRTGLLTWADDSGLEVDALDGRPGVHSARYGDPTAADGMPSYDAESEAIRRELSDADRYRYLLTELEGVPDDERTARFRCAICIANPDGQMLVVEDSVEGYIIREPIGEQGFGYDPIFYVPEQQMTMAQLPSEVKNKISHRGKAARKAKLALNELLAGR